MKSKNKRLLMTSWTEQKYYIQERTFYKHAKCIKVAIHEA